MLSCVDSACVCEGVCEGVCEVTLSLSVSRSGVGPRSFSSPWSIAIVVVGDIDANSMWGTVGGIGVSRAGIGLTVAFVCGEVDLTDGTGAGSIAVAGVRVGVATCRSWVVGVSSWVAVFSSS